eukprot:2842275-Pyramimonas_sp.AAC.1
MYTRGYSDMSTANSARVSAGSKEQQRVQVKERLATSAQHCRATHCQGEGSEMENNARSGRD